MAVLGSKLSILADTLLVSGTKPVISLRLVSRLLMKSGRLVGRLLVSIGSARPFIRLRPVGRLLIKCGR